MAISIDETWYERPPGIRERQGAGGIVARLEGDGLLVALVRGDGLEGYLIPKGGVEPGETIEEAARREIEEEAGLTDLELLDSLGTRERLCFARDRWQTTHYFVFLTSQSGGVPTDSSHEYLVEWFPLDALPSMFWPEQRALIEENRTRIEAAVHRNR